MENTSINISADEHTKEHATASSSSTTPQNPSDVKPKSECCHSMDSRNLIVCIDGTANQFGEKNTNVIELYNLILKEDEHNQRTWYNSGIGTYARPSWKSFKFYRQVISHKIDLAIAWNFERTILAAYQWLSDNYQTGDCIYLFGFSRGAYQVRALSAMIDKVGLIHKGNETQIPFAYELYADPKSDLPTVTRVGSSQAQEKMSMAQRFKETFSYKDVTVHFVGAWDTVSSIGIARSKNILPRTVDGMTHVCYFRHALALDERRVKFLPEYAYGGAATPPKKPENLNIDPGTAEDLKFGKKEPTLVGRREHPQTIEVWFAGTHSDIGGGNVKNAGMDRSRPPLRWMVFEARALGLRTAPFTRGLSRNEQIQVKESLTPLWWPLEFFCFDRLTYTRGEQKKKSTRKPHLGFPRKIHLGQKIHSSLLLSNNIRYTPKARPLDDDPNFWENVHKMGLGKWLEFDLYKSVQADVQRFISEHSESGISLEILHNTSFPPHVLQAVYDGLINALRHYPQAGEKIQVLGAAVGIIRRDIQEIMPLHLGAPTELYALVSDIDIREGHRTSVQQFLSQIADSCIIVITGHTDLLN